MKYAMENPRNPEENPAACYDEKAKDQKIERKKTKIL
jgi:ribosomal protein L25 (general stress protein Ctc)